MWIDPLPIECPRCGAKGEWPERLDLPTCGDCLRYGSPAVRMLKVKPAGPESEPPPKPPSTREILSGLAAQMAEIAERLERLEGNKKSED